MRAWSVLAAVPLVLVAVAAALGQPSLYPDRELDTGLGPVTDVAFSPDGRLLAVVGASGRIGVWDAQTGSRIRLEVVSSRPLRCVTFGPQGNHVGIGAEDGAIHLFDLRTGTTSEAARHRKAATSIAFSPDGSMGASGDADGLILLWSAPQGGEVGSLREQGHKGEVVFLGFTPQASLVSVGRDVQIITWDVKARRTLRRGSLQLEGAGKTSIAEAASLEAGGALLAVASQYRLPPRGGALTGRRGPARPDDIKRVNVIVPYAVETGLSKDPVECGDFLAERMALAPGGCFALFSSFYSKLPELHVWDLVESSGTVREDLPVRATALALELGGRLLALGFENGWIRTIKVSGLGARDCEVRRAKGVAPPKAEARVAVGAETEPLIPAGAGFRVAVLRFEAGGVEAYLGDAVGEMLAAELANSRHVKVVERKEIEAIVKEMAIQRSGLTTADAVRIGRGLNARKVVFGSVRRFGEGTYVILVRLVDVETQQVEGTRQVTCEGCAEKDLPRAVGELTRLVVR